MLRYLNSVGCLIELNYAEKLQLQHCGRKSIPIVAPSLLVSLAI